MKAGNFNINDYLNKLHENVDDGNLKGDPTSGIIPDGNQKSFGWIKREFDKNRTEVKVEINMGGLKFEPGYELQTDLNSVKDFKPGMYGEIKTSDTPGAKKETKDSAPTQAEEEGKKPENEKKAEKSTGGEKPKKSGIQAKVKTAEETKEPKKEEKDEKKEEKDEKKKDFLKEKE